jgi:hypothetical protein
MLCCGRLKKYLHTKRRSKTLKLKGGIKWVSVVSFVALAIIGIAFVNSKQDKALPSEPKVIDKVSIHHAHGMSYSPDGTKIFFAVHDGLRVFQNGQWLLPAGPKHDYMGFSMVDDGFYSSGHPAPGSDVKNPLGIVKSTDEGKSFEPLALYGEVDFHGLSAGYTSHALYVFNPSPNSQMNQAGLHYSTDEAETWTKSESRGLEGQPAAISVHPSDPAVVAVGTDRGIYVSEDHGNQFTKAGPSFEATSVFFQVTGELLAAGVDQRSTLIRIHLDSNELQEISIPEMAEDAIAFIAQSPVNEQDIAIMTFNMDVYLSADQGKTWKEIVDRGQGVSK